MFVEIFLIAVALSMDAFSVAVCKGLGMKKFRVGSALIIALFFGFFQAFMPLLGYFLGMQFSKYIINFDHWIAFILLSIIGGKMLQEALTKKDEDGDNADKFIVSIKELFILAIATSIDALAVGITFATLETFKMGIVLAVTIIGITTFVLSFIGVFTGHKFGDIFKNKAEIVGGIVLILIGVKILVEHLFFQ